eukprot:scaffold1809_cov228-Pinguiococcus_pyrenoidosus.AAC.9
MAVLLSSPGAAKYMFVCATRWGDRCALGCGKAARDGDEVASGGIFAPLATTEGLPWLEGILLRTDGGDMGMRLPPAFDSVIAAAVAFASSTVRILSAACGGRGGSP